jgi:2-polyprenyl-6-methoxyphenol hydroxylase-like FAD-dependent oxidoreductase
MYQVNENACKVLIVGAGPTGLTLANSLYQYGVNCKLIDARPGISKFDSKCTTTHPRILEILDDLGILKFISYEKYLVKGFILKYLKKNKKWKTFFSVATENDFLGKELFFWSNPLCIPQWKIETAMLSALKNKSGHVEYNVKLLSFQQEKDSILATLHDSKYDKKFKVRCQYLIGCDGVKSTVREQLKIQRIGRYCKDFFIIADLQIKDFNYPLDRRHSFVNDKYHIHFAHLENGLFRVFVDYNEKFVDKTLHQLWVGNCQENKEKSEQTLKWFQDKVNELSLPFHLYAPIRFSSYRAFIGYVKQSQIGKIYLAGDAAHSHSPHGGQGMNTGIMDAHNLGWKLAHTISGVTKEIVLNSFNNEREPVWQKLVKRVSFYKNLVQRRTFFTRFLTDYIFPVLPNQFFQKLARDSSMLSLNYRQSSICKDNFSNSFFCFFHRYRGVQVGDRIPDSYLLSINEQGSANKIRLHNFIYGKQRLGDYIVLYFNRQKDAKVGYKNIKELECQIKQCFKAKIAFCYVLPEDNQFFNDNLPILIDIDNATLKRFSVKTEAVYVIRPDGYIAYRNQPFESEKLMKYLQDIFIQLNSKNES